jgi:hypothetical protein
MNAEDVSRNFELNKNLYSQTINKDMLWYLTRALASKINSSYFDTP